MAAPRVKEITVAGVVAAIYAVVTLAFAPISFGVYQVRIAEGLTGLPYLNRGAVAGLFVGCLIANYFGGQGILDILLGPLLTLIAAILTFLISRSDSLPGTLKLGLAPLPPVVLNAFGVSLYLAPLIGVNYWFSVQMIGIGELAACYGLGIPLLLGLRKRLHSAS